MEATAPLDDPLRALFAGKRKWVRVPSSHPVTVRGEGEPYGARLLELSRGGACVILEDERFYEAGVDGFAFVVQRFPDGATLQFTGRDLGRRVRIVRITLHEGRWLALGCELQTPLSPGEAVLLGVAAQEAESPEALAPGLGWAARSDRPVAALLRVPRRELAGPYAAAPVLAAGERALDLLVAGTPERVAEDLARDDLTASVVLGRRRLWEGDLRLVACEALQAGEAPPRVRIRVLAEEGLGKPVHGALCVAQRATD